MQKSVCPRTTRTLRRIILLFVSRRLQQNPQWRTPPPRVYVCMCFENDVTSRARDREFLKVTIKCASLVRGSRIFTTQSSGQWNHGCPRNATVGTFQNVLCCKRGAARGRPAGGPAATAPTEDEDLKRRVKGRPSGRPRRLVYAAGMCYDQRLRPADAVRRGASVDAGIYDQ